MPVTLDQLRAIDHRAPASEVDPLNAALSEAGIDTPARVAHCLGQLCVECIGFTTFTEIWGPSADQTRYERPLGAELVTPGPGVHLPLWQRLGNVQTGDGKRFMGRGAIQLTGRANYAACGAALGLPLEDQPELAALPENRYRVSCWFWNSRRLNVMADAGDVVGITRAINGPGMYGLNQRQAFTAKAMQVLGMDGK